MEKAAPRVCASRRLFSDADNFGASPRLGKIERHPTTQPFEYTSDYVKVHIHFEKGNFNKFKSNFLQTPLLNCHVKTKSIVLATVDCVSTSHL